MDDLDQMSSQFKDYSELKAYSDAQFRTIVEQSKKIHTLEEEVIHLRKILENGTEMIRDPKKTIELFTDVTDQEAICRIELKKLKDLSLERELTLEEAKRTEIYTKLLISLQDKSKLIVEPTKRLGDSELLSLLTEGSNEQSLQN